MKKSFILVEFLVVTFIIALLSALIFPNYRAGEKQFVLLRSTYKLTQDIRRAEEMAMSAKSFNCSRSNWQVKGYGINLTAGDDYYFIKVRCENTASPGTYDDTEVEKIYLEEGVKILSVTPGNVFFYPPEPEVDFGSAVVTEAVITLSLKTDETKTKTIKINKAGLIYVE